MVVVVVISIGGGGGGDYLGNWIVIRRARHKKIHGAYCTEYGTVSAFTPGYSPVQSGSCTQSSTVLPVQSGSCTQSSTAVRGSTAVPTNKPTWHVIGYWYLHEL